MPYDLVAAVLIGCEDQLFCAVHVKLVPYHRAWLRVRFEHYVLEYSNDHAPRPIVIGGRWLCRSLPGHLGNLFGTWGTPGRWIYPGCALDLGPSEPSLEACMAPPRHRGGIRAAASGPRDARTAKQGRGRRILGSDKAVETKSIRPPRHRTTPLGSQAVAIQR